MIYKSNIICNLLQILCEMRGKNYAFSAVFDKI